MTIGKISADLTRVALLFTMLTTGLGSAPAATAGAPRAVPVGASSGAISVLVALRATSAPRGEGVAVGGSAIDGLAGRIGATASSRLFDLPAQPAQLDGTQSAAGAVTVYRLTLPDEASAGAAIAVLTADPAVAFAERDSVAHLVASPPTDPLYASQWGLAKIEAPGAWASTTGSSGVTIAVIDSGVDQGHEDLAGQLWTNPGEIAGNGLDDDNDGYVDDIHGWNIYGNNADLSDSTGHGTQVAGVIAAAANNGVGGAGVCWGCRLMIVKVTQPGGIANYSDIAAGVAYAAAKGAKVINLSLGGASDSATLRAAVSAAAQTAVVVGGAGNDNSAAPFYPAAYDEALAVAGTDANDVKTSTSNYGSWVDIAAPGEAITTTLSSGGYGGASGTSVAAPFASGLAGLLRSQHPDWSAALVRAQIIHTAVAIDDLNVGIVNGLGSGRIDAEQASTKPPEVIIRIAGVSVNGQPGEVLPVGSTSTLSVSLISEWGSAPSASGVLSSNSAWVTVHQSTATWGAVDAAQTAANSANPFTLTIASAAAGHTVPLTLTVVSGGKSFEIPLALATERPTLTVGGTITTDTTWSGDRTYLVSSSLAVSPGVTLTIEPGAIVKFGSGRALWVSGTLIAAGTPEHPIVFTSSSPNPQPGDWGDPGFTETTGGLRFLNTSTPPTFDADGNYLAGSLLRYAVIEYSTGINLQSSALFIDHSIIRRNLNWGGVIQMGASIDLDPSVLTHNLFDGNVGDILVQHNGPVRFIGNLVINNTGGLNAAGTFGVATEVISNTLIDNVGTSCRAYVTVACLENGSPYDGHMLFRGNNIARNAAANDLVSRNANRAIDATGNYWDSVDPDVVASRIRDIPFGEVITYLPIASAPVPDAPAFLYAVSINPGDPIGIQRATFDFTFSAPMDQSIDPTVSFGAPTAFTDTVLIDHAQWLNATTWRATYDFTSLNPRGMYTLNVSGAGGLDGLTIPTDTRFGFTLDYAGQITDQTAPTLDRVTAGGGTGGVGSVAALWQGSDTDSAITGYRYAIGTAPGTSDIVNWTNTASPQLTRGGLGLVPGQTYWLSVQARNVGGLWSPVAMDSFTAGQPLYWIELPLLRRQ